MTETAALRAQAAEARRAAHAGAALSRGALPCGEAKREDVKFASEFRAEPVTKDGQDFYLIEGYASITERGYEMWDMFGPYEEIVSGSAFDATLAADPMVVYRFNHGGMAMASTQNGRLELSADSLGLRDRALVNPNRADVRDLITGIEDRDVTEQSFMFMIDDGEWSADFTQFRITQANLDRGDVGPVTYGANPYTLIASRAGEFLSAIPDMPVLAAREAMARLAQRSDITPYPNTLPGMLYAPTTTTTTGTLSGTFTAPDYRALSGLSPVPAKAPEATGKSLRLRLAQLEMDRQAERR